MSVVSLAQALVDSAALHEAAVDAGITDAQARKFAAALAELPIEQVIRLCTSAQHHLRTAAQRQRRK